MERHSRQRAPEGRRSGAPGAEGPRRRVAVHRNVDDPTAGDDHAQGDAAAHRAEHRGAGETDVPEPDRQVGDQGRQGSAGEDRLQIQETLRHPVPGGQNRRPVLQGNTGLQVGPSGDPVRNGRAGMYCSGPAEVGR